MKRLRAVVYVRVSTPATKRRRGDTPAQRPETQVRPLRAFAARRGWRIAAQIVERESGAAVDREGWREVMRLARGRRVDVVLVAALDRVGRSLAHLVTQLAELQALDVGFVSLREAVDATTPAGRAMLGMAGVFAEFERELIRDRVRAGVDRARREGKRLGRPAVRVDVARALALRSQGKSLRAVAATLGIGKTTLAAKLQDLAGGQAVRTARARRADSVSAAPRPRRRGQHVRG